MRPIRVLADGVKLVRPLLRWSLRAHTEAFCRENGIRYRIDPMNDDPAFTRVRVRKTIIPNLAQLNPRIVETLARTAELMRTADVETGTGGHKLSEAETREGRKVGRDDPGGLRLSDLKTLERQELYAELRLWLRGSRGNLRSIGLKHIEAIERLIFSRKSGRKVELPGGGAVEKHRGSLVFRNIKVEK